MRFKFFIRKKSYLDKIEFKFNEPENVACIVCNHILNNQHPILYVTHDEDDGGNFSVDKMIILKMMQK